MNTLKYKSTRDENKIVSASEAIIEGLSSEGGLFIPESLDEIQFDLNELKDLNYRDLTKVILKNFLTDFSEEQINKCVDLAYSKGKFDTEELVKISQAQEDNCFFLELWHGPTAAFKDMALTLLPHLLTTASQNINENHEIVILTATSGDTGKAALEGFKNVNNTQIIVFYPRNGVSFAQETQMNTTEGNNVHVISVNGNFDDTQNGVKSIFNNQDFNNLLKEKGFILSSANSINIGRLLPQIVYYYYAYFELVRLGKLVLGEKINFVVPSGNFGDILAGYYAQQTGLPINKLVCASNINNILTDFFNTGEYNINRNFYKTTSPSMDILISSNLERLLYDKLGNSDSLNLLMADLAEMGVFKTDNSLYNEFLAEYATENEVKKEIRETFNSVSNLIDPHTAVGEAVFKKLKDQLKNEPTVILSTANPFKFPKTVYESISLTENQNNELDIQDDLEELTGISRPTSLSDLKEKPILHNQTCEQSEMMDIVETILNNE